jgi:dipeptidyl aminopeptidase/acylaminoacyl peptidase
MADLRGADVSKVLCAACLATLVLLSGASAQPGVGDDGTIVENTPCEPLPEHAKLDEFGRGYFDAASWERIRADAGVDCEHLFYLSKGHKVEGFLLRPAARGATPLPAIIYNRGGTGDYSRIDAPMLAEMRLLVQQGFVVAASNYRFVGELARKDEWGGADLDDVLNLIPLLKSRPEVDSRNLFMLGVSRGGLMTYLALKHQAPVNAAAVIAGTTDITRYPAERPEFVLGWEGYDGWAKVWPDFIKRSKQILEERSAVYWPEQIKAPVLILHSRTDSRVPVEQAIALAEKLQERGGEYELIVYGRDGHSLPLHREDRNRRIVEWFRAHQVPPP